MAIDTDQVDLSLTIRSVNLATGANSISTNPTNVTEEGNIFVSDKFDPTDGTLLMFRIGGKIFSNDKNADGFSFKSKPICVIALPSSQTTCQPGEGLAGFEVFKTFNDRKLYIQLPAQNQIEYKYSLFLNKWVAGVGKTEIVIDPKIKNGGINLVDHKTISPSPTSLMPWTGPADLSGGLLLILAFVVLVAGVLIGRAWARSE